MSTKSKLLSSYLLAIVCFAAPFVAREHVFGAVISTSSLWLLHAVVVAFGMRKKAFLLLLGAPLALAFPVWLFQCWPGSCV